MFQSMKVLSNLSHLSRYGSIRSLCYNKDVSQSVLLPSSDFLLQNLKNATSPKNVLNIVKEQYSILNSKHTIQALRSIFDLQKCGGSDASTKEILRHPDFEKLCKKLKLHSGVMELKDTIEALKVITYIGVPSNSTITQVLLQIVRHNLNFLNLHQVIFLDFILCRFHSSPLVDALKIALPIVFEVHLPKKMDRYNAVHLAEYLHYASKVNLSQNSTAIIVDALNQCNEEFDAKTAKSIIWSVTALEPSELFEGLINRAVNDLMIHADDLNFVDLEITLTKLTHKYSRRSTYLYKEQFFEFCANYVIDKALDINDSIYMLKKFGKMNHHNKYLLDYVSKKIMENENYIKNADPSNIFALVVSVSLTDYRPACWDQIKDQIIKKENIAEDRKDIVWIRFAAALCLLDICKSDVLMKALNPDYLKTIFRQGFKSELDNYLTICQCIQLYRPDFMNILPSTYKPEQIARLLKNNAEYPLKSSLQKGLGGEQYLIDNLVSKKGCFIDYAILFKKDGYPIAINKEGTEFLEEIVIPQEADLLVILALKSHHYTINTKQLKESAALTIKMLETNGYSVVPINMEVWVSLSDFEKIPYLMQKIKTKVDIDESVLENAL